MQENKPAVIGELLRQFDPSYGSDDPIYTPDGEWSYARFEHWLVGAGVAAWPRLESGQLDIDSDAFRMMYHIPGIEGLHALRDSLGFIARREACRSGATGATGRACFRSAPRPAATRTRKSLYNAHAGMRSFMVFPPDTIGAYLDWRTQEVGVAAARVRRRRADGRLRRRRRLSRARSAVRPHRRPGPDALEEQTTRPCASA